jgi:hypothetical protein
MDPRGPVNILREKRIFASNAPSSYCRRERSHSSRYQGEVGNSALGLVYMTISNLYNQKLENRSGLGCLKQPSTAKIAPISRMGRFWDTRIQPRIFPATGCCHQEGESEEEDDFTMLPDVGYIVFTIVTTGVSIRNAGVKILLN